MEMTLEGSNSAETFPPRDGVARLHRPVTGKLAIWCDNYYFFFFPFLCEVIIHAHLFIFPFFFFGNATILSLRKTHILPCLSYSLVI